VIHLLDTSSIIDIKKQVPVDKQWAVFRRLEDLVTAGEIAMPRQVIRELVEVAHPDAPGVWARGMQPRLQHPLDVDYEHVREVMRVAPNLVEANQQKDVADPYVVGLALQLRAAGEKVQIVTDDVKDHLTNKIALATACDRFSLPHITCAEFLAGILATI
jgi:predicted nucleic acid-binding protein